MEALVERGSFCIDGTVFLSPDRGPTRPRTSAEQPAPMLGTFDKLLIDGRYYSDKPPLVSVPLAAGVPRTLVALGAAEAERAAGRVRVGDVRCS